MDERRSRIETDFADAALALLMDWSAEDEGDWLWEEYCTDEQQMPPELDTRCRSLIQTHTKKIQQKTKFLSCLKAAGQTAACLGIILFLTVSLITSVEALRVPVLNFFLKHSPRATTILFQQPPQESPLEELQGILKFYVPEGYTLELEQIHRDEYYSPPVVRSIFLAFQDQDDNLLTIQVCPAEGTWNVDTEDASVTKMMLEDQQAVLIEKSPEISVFWLNKTQGLLYSVAASHMEKSDFMEYVTLLAQETRYANAGLSE